MKAIETTATIAEDGQLKLDCPLSIARDSRVRVIVLIPDEDALNDDSLNDDSLETIAEGLHDGWQQALTGKTRPVAALWDALDGE